MEKTLRPKELAKKKDLSFDEALSVIEYFDGKIKEAASLRSPQSTTADKFKNLVSGASARFTGLTTLGGIPFFSAGVATDIIPLTIAGFAVGMVGMISVLFHNEEMDEKVASIFSRDKYKKYKRESFFEEQLFEMGEEEYQKAVFKIIRKARPAIDVVNSHILDEELTYIHDRGSEGFALKPKDIEGLSQWDRIALKVPESENRRASVAAIIRDSTKEISV